VTATDRAEWIRKRAYEIWESEGRPHGRDMEHWLLAETGCQPDSAAAVERKPAARRRKTVRDTRGRGKARVKR
jgi:DUF2934 family protein